MTSLNIIYGLVDPRDNQIKYVGQTTQGIRRYNGHLSKTCRKDRKSGRCSPCQIWIRKLIKLELKPEFYILHECQFREELNEAEIAYIRYYKFIGAKLKNVKEGGYIPPEKRWKHTPESLEKLRKANTGKKRTEAQKETLRLAHLGIKHTAETCLKMSRSKKGKMPCINSLKNLKDKNTSIRKPIVDQHGTVYESVHKTAILLNTSGSNIRRQIRGEFSHIKGFKFIWKEVI